MIDDMGIFRTSIHVSSIEQPKARQELTDVMVDTGAAYNWIPRTVLEALGVVAVRVDRFATADKSVIEREVGFAMVYAAGRSAPAAVVFAEAGDMVLLGAHGLAGMNLRVDLLRKELVPGGPVPVAEAA